MIRSTLLAVAKTTPAWVKTTMASWTGTVTGLGIAQYKEDIQVVAIIVGGILIPIASLAYQVCKSKEVSKEK